MRTKFSLENLNRRHNSEDLGVDGGNIRMNLGEIGWEDVQCMHPAQDRD